MCLRLLFRDPEFGNPRLARAVNPAPAESFGFGVFRVRMRRAGNPAIGQSGQDDIAGNDDFGMDSHNGSSSPDSVKKR